MMRIVISDSFRDRVAPVDRCEELGIGCNFDVFSYFFLLRKIFNRLISGNCEMNFSWLLTG